MSGFELIARAETEATSWDGSRKSEWGPWQSVTAPDGFVINKDKIKV
ncbi:alkaline protease, partial [Bacillus cereus]|nr:alkaline protease [Bacillus cereus]